MEENRKFEPFDIVRHFKREQLATSDSSLLYYYKIVGDGFYTETNELVMIYEAIYWPHQKYVRPYDMFMSRVDREKYPEIKQEYRFEKVTGEELTDVIKKISCW